MSWKPEPFDILPSIVDYLKAGELLWINSTVQMQHIIYYVPRNAIVELKAKVLGET